MYNNKLFRRLRKGIVQQCRSVMGENHTLLNQRSLSSKVRGLSFPFRQLLGNIFRQLEPSDLLAFKGAETPCSTSSSSMMPAIGKLEEELLLTVSAACV